MHTPQVQSELLMLPVEITISIFDYFVSETGVCIDQSGSKAEV